MVLSSSDNFHFQVQTSILNHCQIIMPYIVAQNAPHTTVHFISPLSCFSHHCVTRHCHLSKLRPLMSLSMNMCPGMLIL